MTEKGTVIKCSYSLRFGTRTGNEVHLIVPASKGSTLFLSLHKYLERLFWTTAFK